MHALVLALTLLLPPLRAPFDGCTRSELPLDATAHEPQVSVGILRNQRRIELIAIAPVIARMRDHGDATEVEVSRGARIIIERRGAVTQARRTTRCRSKFTGELTLWVDGMELGHADDIVSLAPVAGDVALEAPNVPFAEGYSWGGVARRRYRGELIVTFGQEGLLDAINRLGIEALLRGVVPSEMPASSPPEALKAQAIAARNFIVTNLGRLHLDSPFDFCSEQHCQVYGGFNDETFATNKAVSETAGEVLYLGDKPVRAKYSARCGGHTESNEVAWAEAPDAALRGRSDLRHGAPGPRAALIQPEAQAWCDAPGAKRLWHVEPTHDELVAQLGPRAAQIAPLRDILGVGRGPGQRLKKLVVVGEKGRFEVTRELPIRRALGQLRSAAIELVPTHDEAGKLVSMSILGIGWGHGVGMCQQGAIARASAGQSCGSILGHYFAGARSRALWTEAVTGCP